MELKLSWGRVGERKKVDGGGEEGSESSTWPA